MKEPELRFKEFKDEWQPRKLSEFSEKINEKNESESYTNVLTNSAVYGVVNQQDFFKKDIANPENIERYTIVKDNDYMYNPRISKYAKFGPVNRNKLNTTGVVSPMYLVFRTDTTVSLGFLDNYFLSSYWHKYVYSKGNTGARADRIAIKDSDFMNMEILMPSLEEQQKIAKFFADLDSQIELQSDKLETLKRDKKGYIQKMFPSDDNNAPKLRLKGFKGEWKTYSLDDLVDKFDENRMPVKEKDREKGNTPYYGANGVQDYVNGYTHDGEYILIAEDGANSITNYPIYTTNGKIWVNNHAHVLQGKENFTDTKFMSYLLGALDFRTYLTGSGRYKLNASIMMNIKAKIPSYNEQQKIGMFFDSLDKQIELQQQKLTDLKQQKKAYLQKMFM